MKRNCPRCPAKASSISYYGHYFRKSDSKQIQRFRCRCCGAHFSQGTFSSNYHQNKRRLNPVIQNFLCSSVSQRRLALLLGVSRTTVKRKFDHLSQVAKQNQALRLAERKDPYFQVQFDDLETIEHTKYKPVTVTLAVDMNTREIIDFCVAQIPAKGLLAKFARKKYGYRPDHSRAERRRLFKRLKSHIHPKAEFHTDQHQDYPLVLQNFFPHSTHISSPRQKSAAGGQGELKKVKFDPLFAINHTFAMLRANINRLVRDTWCTTKKIEALEKHIAIYVDFHNSILIKV